LSYETFGSTGGGQALEKWSDQVRDVLGTLFFMMGMFVGTALIVRDNPPVHTNGAARPVASAAAMYGGVSPGSHTRIAVPAP
jgi:hypothetical protein